MTRDEILSIPAGRDIDECIQRHVMKLPDRTHNGWFYDDPECSYYACRYCGASLDPKTDDSNGEPCIKHYSTDISAAWKVFRTRYLTGQMIGSQVCDPEGEFEGIKPTDITDTGYGLVWFCTQRGIPIYAKTVPLAICRAALLAVMEDRDE